MEMRKVSSRMRCCKKYIQFFGDAIKGRDLVDVLEVDYALTRFLCVIQTYLM